MTSQNRSGLQYYYIAAWRVVVVGVGRSKTARVLVRFAGFLYKWRVFIINRLWTFSRITWYFPSLSHFSSVFFFVPFRRLRPFRSLLGSLGHVGPILAPNMVLDRKLDLPKPIIKIYLFLAIPEERSPFPRIYIRTSQSAGRRYLVNLS